MPVSREHDMTDQYIKHLSKELDYYRDAYLELLAQDRYNAANIPVTPDISRPWPNASPGIRLPSQRRRDLAIKHLQMARDKAAMTSSVKESDMSEV